MRIGVGVSAIFILAACGSGRQGSAGSEASGPSLASDSSGEDAAGAPSSTVVSSSKSCDAPFKDKSNLKFTTKDWKTNFCEHSVPYSEIRGGGPPRDGIPPIDKPKFVTQAEANRWIRDVEPVIALEVGGVARAYPLQILIWHEIVNDELNKVPIAVTFCPLCYAALVFRRPTIKGNPLTFGTSGNLRHSDMVMWDRQTESWWQQFEGLAIVGGLTGTKLESLPASIVSWKSFKESFPDAEVLSRDTGIKRPYGKNPYAGYDDVDKKPFLYKGKVGKGLAPMEHIVGVDKGKSARAYSIKLLRSKRIIHDKWNNQNLVVFWQTGTSSALDKEIISDGDDAGATGVFLSEIDGRKLTFVAKKGDGFRDKETGSEWDIFGHARSGTLKGRQLKALAHHRVFWFAWSAFVGERGTLYSK